MSRGAAGKTVKKATIKKALASLEGKPLPVRDFVREVGKIRASALTDLPVEFGVFDVIDLARSNSWFSEDESGLFHVSFKKSAATRSAKKLARHRKGRGQAQIGKRLA